MITITQMEPQGKKDSQFSQRNKTGSQIVFLMQLRMIKDDPYEPYNKPLSYRIPQINCT